MTVEWIDVKKPVGDFAQWQVLPTYLNSLPSGQVFFTLCSPSYHDKHRKGTLHGGKTDLLIDATSWDSYWEAGYCVSL